LEPILEPVLRELRIRKARKRLPLGGRVCDIFCGKEGKFLFRIAGSIKEGVGHDRAVSILKKGNISFRKIEISDKISEASESFDCVTLLAALEHAENPNAIIGECFRILKPGGSLLVTTPAPAGKKILEFLAFKAGLLSKDQIMSHRQYYDEKRLFNLFCQAGFNSEKIKIEKFEFGYNLFAVVLK
ncbi:MAG: methyltransferase domain-containing protein, partial [Candidatus Portnoybacteria bacterium]|nr:methyltransferase domain-containing protein [Candidatus Portnoybacteria bacterium]